MLRLMKEAARAPFVIHPYLTRHFVYFQIVISKSYDATTHFETTVMDIKDIYRRATGAEFDMSKVQGKIDSMKAAE